MRCARRFLVGRPSVPVGRSYRPRLEWLEDRTAPATLAVSAGSIQVVAALGESVHLDISANLIGSGNLYSITNVGGPLTLSGNPNGTWSQNGPDAVQGTDVNMGFPSTNLGVNLTDGNDTVIFRSLPMIDSAGWLVTKSGDGSLGVTLGSAGSVPNVQTRVTVNNSGGAAASLTLDDSADTTGRTIAIGTGSVVGLTASPAAPVLFTGLSTLNVLCGPAPPATPNVLNILGTSAPLYVQGAGGNDTVTVGGVTSGNVLGAQAIAAPVAIANPGGSVNLTVDDSADTQSRETFISSGSITRLAPATISYAQSDMASLTVKGCNPGPGGQSIWQVNGIPASDLLRPQTTLIAGSGYNQVQVFGTSSNSQLAVDFTGSNVNILSIGDNSASAQGIMGSVFAFSPASTFRLSVTDSGDTIPRHVELDSLGVSGIAPARISWGSGLNTLDIAGGSGATFDIVGTPSDPSGAIQTVIIAAFANQIDVEGTNGDGGANLTIENNLSSSVILGYGVNRVQQMTGAVAVQFGTLTVDDSADSAAQTNVVVGATSITGLAPAAISLLGINALTVDGGSGGNTFTVTGTACPLTLNAGSGTNQVTLGINGVLSGLLASVSIDSPGGGTALTVDDSADTTGRKPIISDGSITGFAGASGNSTISYAPTDLTSLTIDGTKTASDYYFQGNPSSAARGQVVTTLNAGPGNDYVRVLQTSGAGGAKVNVNGGGGQDTVEFWDNALTVQNVTGVVSIGDAPGAMAVNVYDYGDAVGRNAMVSYTQLIGLAPAAIQYDPSALRALTVDGSSGNGTFTVTSTPSNATVPVPTAIGDFGTDQVRVDYVSSANGAGLTLTNLYPAASSYTIGGSGTSVAGFGPVSIQDFGFPISLTVNDSADAAARNVAVTNTTITGLPLASLSYSDTAQLNLLLGSGANQVDVSEFTGNGSLSGSGSATLIAAGSADFTLTDALFTRSGGGTARLALAGFSNALLTATGPGTHYVNATAFSGTATIVNPTDPPAAIVSLSLAQTTAIVTDSYGTATARITDAQGNPLGGVPVTFAVVAGGGGAGASFAGNATVSTNAQGVAVAPALTANTVAGSFAVTATAAGLTRTQTLTNLPGVATTCSSAGGNAQNTIVGTAFATSLQALVTDAYGNPVAGVPVTFSVPAAGASGAFSTLPTVLTDAQGLATAPRLIANHVRGTFTVTAAAPGISKSASFQLINTARPAAMTPVAGNNQRGTVGDAFTTALAVKVVDGFGNPVRGITVEFVAPSSDPVGAAFSGAASVLTDANGVATAPKLIANDTVGAFTVEAWVGGLKMPILFTLSSVASTPAAISAFAGSNQNAAPGTAFVSALRALVSDAFGNPVKGAVVTFTVAPTGTFYRATFVGSKPTVTAITDTHGIATAPVLTAANVNNGTFTVVATVPGASTPAVFNLSNIRPVGHK